IEDDRVIPAIGGKPPRTPTRRTPSRHSTSNYDPAASVENHQSREGSRASHRSEERPPSIARQTDSRASRRSDGRSPSAVRRTPSRQSRRASRQDTQALYIQLRPGCFSGESPVKRRFSCIAQKRGKTTIYSKADRFSCFSSQRWEVPFCCKENSLQAVQES
ncbi:hypothetical protein OSTOST_01015, partial [Ostertagia ostertagi]